MYSLIIDSATKILYIALVNDEKILYENYINCKNYHAKNIVSKIDEALKLNNITTDNLDEVIVGVGPGSYTGVRMAVTVAKMLATFKNIKLYKISTLKLMASGYKCKVLALIDARRNNSFATIIDIENNNYILNEGMYDNDSLLSNEFDYKVTDESYLVDPLYVLENKEYVENYHLLVPNYLRDTEAERNLND